MTKVVISTLTALMLVWSLAGCKSSPQQKIDKLTKLGYKLNTEDLHAAASAGETAALELFQEADFPLDTPNERGQTALHLAAANGHNNAVEYLLEQGLDVKLQDFQGHDPLFAATSQDHHHLIKALLRYEADPSHQDIKGYRPITLAALHGHEKSVEELAPYSQEWLDDALFIASLQGNTDVIEILTNYGASVFSRVDDGRTPLMLAAQQGHKKAVTTLLQEGANRFATTEEGQTAAQLAKAEGHEEVAQILNKPPEDKTFSISLLHKESSNSPVQLADSTGDLKLEKYVEQTLPLRVESVDKNTAKIRYLYGKHQHKMLKAGDAIPDTPLTITKIQARHDYSKVSQGGQPVDLSTVEVKDNTTGQTRELLANMGTAAQEPVAYLRNIKDPESGELIAVTRGTELLDQNGIPYLVTDVRPTQVILENLETGEPSTLEINTQR